MVKITREDQGINFDIRDYIILVERFCYGDQSYSNVKMINACMKLDIQMTASVNEILSAMINKVADNHIKEYIGKKKAEYDELMLFNRTIDLDNLISKLEDNLKNNIYMYDNGSVLVASPIKVEGDIDTDWTAIYMYQKEFSDIELDILHKTNHLGVTNHMHGNSEESYVNVDKLLKLSIEDRKALIVDTFNSDLENLRLAVSNAANATTLNLDDKYKWVSENLNLYISSYKLEKID